MGMEKYEEHVRKAKNTLTYPPGWSADNKTGAWRALRPVKDIERCVQCAMCWLFCPEGCIDRETLEIDYDYCKGCGICGAECRRGALEMEREAE